MSSGKGLGLGLDGIGGARMDFTDNKGKGQEEMEVADKEEDESIVPLRLPTQYDPSSDEESSDEEDCESDQAAMKKAAMKKTDEEDCESDQAAMKKAAMNKADEEDCDSDDEIPIMKKHRMSTPKLPIAKKLKKPKVSSVIQHHFFDNKLFM